MKSKRKSGRKETNVQGAVDAEPWPPSTPPATLSVEALEPRILLSGTWFDADTGDPIADATEGNDDLSKRLTDGGQFRCQVVMIFEQLGGRLGEAELQELPYGH